MDNSLIKDIVHDNQPFSKWGFFLTFNKEGCYKLTAASIPYLEFISNEIRHRKIELTISKCKPIHESQYLYNIRIYICNTYNPSEDFYEISSFEIVGWLDKKKVEIDKKRFEINSEGSNIKEAFLESFIYINELLEYEPLTKILRGEDWEYQEFPWWKFGK